LLTMLGAQTASGFYDPNLQRWLTLDPIGETGGINLYQFVGNDPVNRIDPDGLNPILQRIIVPAANWIGRTPAGRWIERQGDRALAVGTRWSQTTWQYGKALFSRAPAVPKTSEVFCQNGQKAVRQLPDSYTGIRQASQYLKEMGVSRTKRVEWLQSFEAGTVRARAANASEYGLRFFDNINALPRGRFLFESFPASRQSLAIFPRWNQMSGIAQWKIRPGVTIIEGRAALQAFWLEGGQWQKFVLNSAEDLLAR
ncbi:MAG: RHS repeat-associated core domain-containing protein, partial [Verrucomicrobia bacterium]|nr:RHS repeat-associated core domain-containing protein [Verrucomicrobiota bacterium]